MTTLKIFRSKVIYLLNITIILKIISLMWNIHLKVEDIQQACCLKMIPVFSQL